MATVLVVDDQEPIVDLVRRTLEDDQLRVVATADGVEALECARAYLPDLIFVDVRMSRLNGVELCERLRQEPGLANSKIVILIPASQGVHRASGAEEHLTKPFSPLKLLSLVQSLLPAVSLWPVHRPTRLCARGTDVVPSLTSSGPCSS
jgi:CheY-like chemotaxis protein